MKRYNRKNIYLLDNNGNIPASITANETDICSTGAADCTGLIDLSVLTNNGKYLVSLPKDPQNGDATNTHYAIKKDANERVVVNAPDAEQGKTISVTR